MGESELAIGLDDARAGEDGCDASISPSSIVFEFVLNSGVRERGDCLESVGPAILSARERGWDCEAGGGSARVHLSDSGVGSSVCLVGAAGSNVGEEFLSPGELTRGSAVSCPLGLMSDGSGV